MRLAYQASGAAAGSDWQQVNVTTVHRAIPVPPELGAIVANPGTVIWAPPFPCLVRAFTINDDEGDPLDGGDEINIGMGATASGVLVAAAEEAFVLTRPPSAYESLVGWGDFFGPGDVQQSAEGGIVLAPEGTLPGRPQWGRPIVAIANSGDLVGTLHFRFQMQPTGAWM